MFMRLSVFRLSVVRLPVVRLPSSVFLSLLVLLLPSPASAQQPDTQPNPPVTIGPLAIRPAFFIRNIGRDGNVFNEESDPKSDFTMTISPAADVVFKVRRLRVTYDQQVDYVYFDHYASERGTNLSSSVRTDLDLGVLQPFVSVAGVNTKDRFGNEIDARARRRERTYSAGVGLKLFSRTTAHFAAKNATTQFDEDATFRGTNLADSLNDQVDILEAGVGFTLTPLTSFSMNVTHERQRFDTASERDSDTLRVMPTFTFSPLGLINGSASIGYRRFSPRSPLTPAFSGLVALVAAGVTVYDRHRFDVIFNRDLTYSYDRETPYYIGTAGSLTWTYVVFGPVDVKLTAGHNTLNYRGPGGAAVGDDRFASYGAGAGYRLRRTLRFGIQGEWSHRNSERALDRDYSNHRVYATLTWGS
jgi:hypothetical protein